MKFDRHLSSNLIPVYIPSTLIVIATWLSFWISIEAVPARTCLCVTSMLALVTQFSSIRSQLPALSYVNGVDIWMLVCMFYVFATVVEFAVVKCIMKKRELLLELKNHRKNLNEISNIPEAEYEPPELEDTRRVKKRVSLEIRSRQLVEHNQSYLNHISNFVSNEGKLKKPNLRERIKALRYLTPLSPNGISPEDLRSYFNNSHNSALPNPSTDNPNEDKPPEALEELVYEKTDDLWPTVRKRGLLTRASREAIFRDEKEAASGLPNAVKAKATKEGPKNSHLNQMPNSKRIVEPPPLVQKIEKWSRRLFPLSFVLFNLIYWPLVMTRSL